MSQLSLALLGPFSVTMGDTPITAFRTDKVRALLAYLALEPGQPHSRHTLAGLLWPDLPERQSLDNVRVTLYRLRQTLDAAQPGLSGQVFTVTRQTIQLNAAAIRVDVAAFEAVLIPAAAHIHNQLHHNASLLAQLAQAVALYQGELLAGFSLADAPTYEEWLLFRREQLAARAQLALKTLADAYETQGDWEKAHTYATRLLEFDPYGETSRRQLMRILTHRGLPDQALVQYARLRRLLRDELGVEPNAETVTLYEQIRDGRLVEPSQRPQDQTSTAASSPAAPDEIPFIGPLIGRADELSRLKQWLVQDGCRLVTVVGLGGVGKTSLVTHAARAAAGHFERVLWRSLLNAPPPDRLLVGLLQTLAEQALVEPPTTPDEQLALLFGYLRQRRVLLVLDNLESILDPVQVGRFRPGYELYDQLLWRAATSEHRSVFLLTSRERPDAVARLAGDTPRVRSLLLKGLDSGAGQELLAERGVTGPFVARSALVARYSGNPLALKLVADTVQELFSGDIESFLAEDTLIFDDVRQILEQQLNRLTELEQTILFWLAIERETVDAQTLRHNLVQPPGYVYLESLRGLQNRSLIERRRDGIGLQNVVLEYLTERLVEAACAEILAEQPNLLHRHALVMAEARDDVRQSQLRLILAPIAAQLQGAIGRPALAAKLQRILAGLHQDAPHLPSYAAGNLLNLLLHLEIDISGYDFSHLCVWQADLRGVQMVNVNLTGTDLAHTIFSEMFGRIFSVAIAPQHPVLAAGGTQGEVYLWSFPDGQRAGLLTGHNNSIMSVAFSPDGTLLASGSLDRTIRIWDWRTGRCLRVLAGHNSGVFAVAFSPNGAWLASGSQDNSVFVWDVQTGRQIDELTQHSHTVTAVAFHPAGTILASGSMDHAVCLWDITPLSQRDASQGMPGAARLMDVLHGHSHQVLAVTFSPDGALLASGSADMTVNLWTTTGHSRQATLRGHTHWVRSVVFSPDSSRLFSGSADRAIRIWDVADGRTLEVLRGHEHTIRAVAIHPDGSILASGGLDDTIRLWDLRRQQHERAVSTIRGYVSAIHTVVFSPDGGSLATGDGKGWVRLWLVQVSKPEASTPRTLPGRGMQVNCVTFSPDGKYLASADDDRIVRIWERSSLRIIGMLHGHREAVHTVQFAPQGNVMVTAGYEGDIYLWDISVPAQGRLLTRLSGHTREVNALLITPNGKHIISGASDDTIRVWDFATGRCIQVLEEENAHCKTLVQNPRTALVAAAGWSGSIRLYRQNEQNYLEPVHTFKAHATRISKIAFSPDGTRLVSGGLSGIVRLWDVYTGQQLLHLHGHTQPVQAVAFHPNGHWLASSGEDETVRLWRLEGEQPSGKSELVLRVPGPYAGMNITGATGIGDAQKSTLLALGAVDLDRASGGLAE